MFAAELTHASLSIPQYNRHTLCVPREFDDLVITMNDPLETSTKAPEERGKWKPELANCTRV